MRFQKINKRSAAADRLRAPAARELVWGTCAGVGWFWAITQFTTRHHLALNYDVNSLSPPLWGFWATSPVWLITGLVIGVGVGCVYYRSMASLSPTHGYRWDEPR